MSTGWSTSTRGAALGAAMLVPLAGCGGGGGTGAGDYTAAGLVYVQSSATGSGIRADFYPLSRTSSGCVETTQGDCYATTCPNTSGGGTVSQSKAGKVTVTVGGRVITLAPDPMLDTLDASFAGPLWTGPGVDVEAVGTGAEVPAFTLHTPSPAAITVTAPAFPDGATAMTLHTEADLPVAWTGGGDSDTVSISLTGPIAAATFATVSCAVPASSGQAVVPASLLGMIPKGKEGTFEIDVTTSSTTVSSGWSITLEAGLQGKAGGNALDGTSSNYSAQFE